ncbi:hypothetical protein [Frondihabitans sucicola]|nr:hypothetical protein [Frondihabitans sucicola]
MLRHATAESSRAIAPRHIALALLDRVAPDPAAVLLDALKVDRVSARLAFSQGIAA